jgi:hypothetical protein
LLNRGATELLAEGDITVLSQGVGDVIIPYKHIGQIIVE